MIRGGGWGLRGERARESERGREGGWEGEGERDTERDREKGFLNPKPENGLRTGGQSELHQAFAHFPINSSPPFSMNSCMKT